MAPLTRDEALRLRKLISAALCNLGIVHFFFVPASRRLVARSFTCSKRHPIPPDAVLIGLYRAPIGARAVLDDLEDLLAAPARRPSEPAIEAPSIAGKRGPDLRDVLNLPPPPPIRWGRWPRDRPR